jgi:cytidylate kinase
MMESKIVSAGKFVKEQLRKWEGMQSEEDKTSKVRIPVITVSGEPGSKGSIIAEKIANRLEFDLFNRDIIKEIAKSVKMSTTVIETLEEERLSGVEIVGRGANFILPSESKFSMRVVAPLDVRVHNVANMFGVSLEQAKQRVIRRESKRRAFIRHSFNADIRDPLNYDLTINTGKVSTASAAEAVIGAILGSQNKK